MGGYDESGNFYLEQIICDSEDDACDKYNEYVDDGYEVVFEPEYGQVCIDTVTTYVTTSNYIDKDTYSRTRYDLGQGWSFNFPSVQITNDDGNQYIYYHSGTGSTYHVDFTADPNDSNLENYNKKDLKFEQDSGSYKNGDVDNNKQQISSAYKLTDINKKITYFSSDGRVMGIVDRFGNQIKFNYIYRNINGVSYPLISQITDSANRIITFTYDNTLTSDNFNGENITVAVTSPGSNKSLIMKYLKYRYKITNSSTGENYYEPVLANVAGPYYSGTNPNVNWEWYIYDASNQLNFRYDEKNLSDMASAPVCLLSKIEYPKTSSNYAYDKVTRNLGPSGLIDGFRLKSRYDQAWKYDSGTSKWSLTGDLNHCDYNYTGDYTGYPTYSSDDTIPTTVSNLCSSQSVSNGRTVNDIFNGNKQDIEVDTSASNGERKITKNLEYDSRFKELPTKSEYDEYASDNTLVKQQYVLHSYNDYGEVTSETKPITADKLSNPEIYTTKYSYDDPNYKFITKKQWYQNPSTPLSETYSYDGLGQELTCTNAKGETTNYSYADTGDAKTVTSTKQLENNKVDKKVEVYGCETNKAFPTIDKEYYTDDSGNSVETKTTKTYDMLLGLPATITDNEGHTTSYEYDSLGRVTAETLPDFKNTDGTTFGVQNTYEYYDGCSNNYSFNNSPNKNLAATIVNAQTIYTNKTNNSKAYYNQYRSAYDGYGNLLDKDLWEYKNNAWVFVPKEEYIYDNFERVVSSIDGENNQTNYGYDAWSNQTETVDSHNNLYKTEYDIKNSKQYDYFVSAANVSSYRSNPANNEYKEKYVETSFDQWDRPIERKAYPNWPDLSYSNSESYSYDLEDNVVGYVDPKKNLNEDGNTKTYVYDPLNRCIHVKDALNHLTDIGYNILGNVQSIQMRENASSSPVNIDTKTYDELGIMTLKTDPESQNSKYTHNDLGLTTKIVDRNQSTFSMGYDEQNRLITDNAAKSDNSLTQKYSYDYIGAYGPANIYDDNNGIRQGQERNWYTSSGNVSDKFINYTSDNYGSYLDNSYDEADKLTNLKLQPYLTTQSAFNINYTYDKERLWKVQTDGASTQNTSDQTSAVYDYYPDGKVKTVTYPKLADGSFLTSEYQYDKLDRLKSLVNKKGSTVLSQFSYTYDDNGNISSATDGAGAATRYVYDKLDRLTEIHKGDNVTVYSYDLKGNRSIVSEDDPTQSINTDTVSYDYDLRDRLSAVTTSEGKTTFKYSPEGLRYEKVLPSKTVQYHYNNDGKVIAESDGSGSVTSDYVWGPDRLLVKKDKTSNKDYYYLYNGHGDVVQIVDTNGNIVNSYDYDAWGNILNQTEGIDNSFKYAGEIYDKETGLYYLRARYYDPQTCRFINEDTVEGTVTDPLSLNWYTYCEDDPVDNVDPTGHEEERSEPAELITPGMMGSMPEGEEVGDEAGKAEEKPKESKVKKIRANDEYEKERTRGKVESQKLKSKYNSNNSGKKTYDKNKGALYKIGKELEGNFKGKGKVITKDEAKILDELCEEYNVPQHHGVQDGSGKHWKLGLDHTHIGSKHIPYR